MPQHHTIEKSLAIYPIPNGNELNVFANGPMNEIRIMNMSGEVMMRHQATSNHRYAIDISTLLSATYIVEVAFDDHKTGRSVFVKF
jgi:hypothetical protein